MHVYVTPFYNTFLHACHRGQSPAVIAIGLYNVHTRILHGCGNVDITAVSASFSRVWDE